MNFDIELRTFDGAYSNFGPLNCVPDLALTARHCAQPQEFFAPFAAHSSLAGYHAPSMFVPPPYLTWLHDCAQPIFDFMAWMDDRLGTLPVLRDMGDHFLIVLTRRDP